MRRSPRLLQLGAIANLILAAAMATSWAYSHPMFATGDEAAHLDYAYQVWKGSLPIFQEGLLTQQTFGVRPPVQWTAQHPPLFYVLQAPFVGPFAEAGNLLAAGYAGRAVNALLTVGLVGAVMWAASTIAPDRDSLWLAAGTVNAMYPLVVEIGGLVLNDNLFATGTALLVGLSARMVRSGPSRKRLVLFAVVASCSLLTRLAGVVVIGVCAATLCATLLLRPRPWRSVAGLVCAVAVAIATSSWFYLRNLRLTGNLAGGHFDYLTQRVERPLLEVVVRGEVWDQLLAIHGYEMVDQMVATLLIVGLPVGVACVIGIHHLVQNGRLVPDVALAVLFTGLVGTVVLMQLMYVSAGGGASKRYLAPLTGVVSFAIAAALTAARQLAPLLLFLWVVLDFVPFAGFVLALFSATLPPNTAPIYPVPTMAALLTSVAALIAALTVQSSIARS